MNDLMLDLETLSNKPNSVITQIGACFFDRNTGEVGEKFLHNVSIQSCLDRGLTVNGSTIKWWFERSKLVTWLDNVKELTWVLSKFREFYYKNRNAIVWSHATFDIPILETAYNSTGQNTPIKYKNTRDIRTLTDISNCYPQKQDGDPKNHNALNDCLYQVEYCVKSIKEVGK